MSIVNDDKKYTLVFWETPTITSPEFRLYYDDTGAVIAYTSDPAEKREGEYIIIDKMTYAACRWDVRVIDGKISTTAQKEVFYKLTPNLNEGTITCLQDMSIIPDKAYKGKTIKWKMTIYEL